MRKAALTLTAVLTLTACGGQADDTAASSDRPTLPPTETMESSEPAPSTSGEPTPTGPKNNQRGNIEKKIGDEGGIADMDGTSMVTFAVDSITPIECTSEYADAPENGHMVALDFRVATAPELATSDFGYFSVSNAEFDFIGSDGVTFDAVDTIATYGCLDEQETLTSGEMAPGSQFRGKVVLDLPEDHGIIVYRPYTVSDGGWEWSF